MAILVLNAGSSTLKFCLLEAEGLNELASGQIDWKNDRAHARLTLRRAKAQPVDKTTPVPDYAATVRIALESLAGLTPASAVGHRVVHGGTRLRDPVRIDSSVKEEIRRLSELAPLHNPPALETIEAAEAALPYVPQVAVFDTAFFAHLPARAHIYPLPYEWYSDWGIRRFGFHGISHAYCASRAAQFLGRDNLRVVICHLGNGCSASAVVGHEAIATTMGFTPLEGLMMGTRSGSIDPGILLHAQRHHGLGADELNDVLNHQSGLKGVSGISGDFRQVEEAARTGNARAALALELYADRVRATIGALAVTLGGVDALVFTAGVGENSASLRAAACRGLECVGLHLAPERNHAPRADSDIAIDASPGRILIVHTREEYLIARETQRLV